MLTVSLPHSQTNRSPPAIDDRSPWQTGQWVFFEISTVVKSMSLKSQTISLFFNVEPTHAKIFIVSIVWRAPIIPVVAPRTPRVLHVNKSESERFGINTPNNQFRAAQRQINCLRYLWLLQKHMEYPVLC